MDTLYLMVTITDRKLEKKFLNFYREQGLEVSLTTLGHGTASRKLLVFLFHLYLYLQTYSLLLLFFVLNF